VLREFSDPGDRVLFATVTDPVTNTTPDTAGDTEPGGVLGPLAEIARGRVPVLADTARGRDNPAAGVEEPALVDQAPDLVVLTVAAHSGGVIARVGVPMPRAGGVLVVLTATGHTGGRLIDPTWSIVAAARRAGARYLAHIIAVHADTATVIAATRAQLQHPTPPSPAAPSGPSISHSPTPTAGDATDAPPTCPPTGAPSSGALSSGALSSGAVSAAAGHTRVHSDVLVFHRPPHPRRGDPPTDPPTGPADRRAEGSSAAQVGTGAAGGGAR
jgi:hypothetical protein